MAKTEWSPVELKSKAEAYCAAAEHCESEVRTKLRQWNCDTRTADEIVNSLYTGNFLSDERYCRAFVHDKLLYQHWGRVKIEYMLRARHLPPAAIRAALDDMDETEYFRVLARLAESKKRTLPAGDDDARNALARFLLQRGFTADEIRRLNKTNE